MWDEIGLLAGDIWTYLNAHGETSTLKLRSSLKVSQSLLFLSLGWLCRENKIHLVYRDKNYYVSIKS